MTDIALLADLADIPTHKLDLNSINDLLLGLVSQAVLEGYNVGGDPRKYKVDNERLNRRREQILALIKTEVEAAIMLSEEV